MYCEEGGGVHSVQLRLGGGGGCVHWDTTLYTVTFVVYTVYSENLQSEIITSDTKIVGLIWL